MNSMKVSFGAKIPLAQRNVYDKTKNKFIKATVYELDGKDFSDVTYIDRQRGNWGDLKHFILSEMQIKYNDLTSGQKLCDAALRYLENKKFYSLENEKGESIALLLTSGNKYSKNVDLFESNPDKKYKFAGQVILAEAVREIADAKDPFVTVMDPSNQGRPFYINNCGFVENYPGSHDLVMFKDQIHNFIKNVEQRTKGGIDIIS